jgi:hypothetical protein
MDTFFNKPIGILYNHARQYNPLLTKLSERGIAFELIDPADHLYDPAQLQVPYSLIFNDMSSPPYLRSHASGIAQTIEYVKHVEKTAGTAQSSKLVNGARASEIFSIKSRQLAVFTALGLPFPRTRVVSSVDQLLEAGSELNFPIIVKSNGLYDRFSNQYFESLTALIHALINDDIQLPGERSWLVQEYISPKSNSFIRVEILNGRVQYAVKLTHADNRPDLIVRAEVTNLPHGLYATLEDIANAALIDAGSIEYLTDRRTNNLYFLSIRPHSSHYRIQPEGLTFNLFDAMATYLEQRLQKVKEIALAI